MNGAAGPAPRGEGRRGLKRRIALALLPGVVALAMVWWQLSGNGVDWSALLGVPWWSYGLVGLMLAANWLTASFRLQLVAGVHRIRLPLAVALRAHVLGAFAASVTPSSTGHGLALGYTLRNSGLSAAASIGVVVFLGAFELIFFAVGGFLALLVFLARQVEIHLATVEAAVAVFGLVGLVAGLLLLANPGPLTRFATTHLARVTPARLREPLLRFTTDFVRAIGESAGAPWWWYAAAGGLTLGMWLAHYLLLNSLAAGFDFPFNWLEWLAAQHLMQLVSMFVPTPGGAGFFELALPILTGGAIPGAVRLPLILVWRVATYYLYLVIGPVAGGSVIGDLLLPTRRAGNQGQGSLR